MLGSPPLTRGIRTVILVFTPPTRFTPAHAGNTVAVIKLAFKRQVHPRSRGEYAMAKLFGSVEAGSPPLTRGIPYRTRIIFVRIRFTPAHAGNTDYETRVADKTEVHPRSRGEYLNMLIPNSVKRGSPPLTRGIRRQFEINSIINRFTPAHAGNTDHQHSA